MFSICLMYGQYQRTKCVSLMPSIKFGPCQSCYDTRAVSTFCKSTKVPPNPYLRDVTVCLSHSALISSYYLNSGKKFHVAYKLCLLLHE